MKSWPRPMDGPIDLQNINIDQFSGPWPLHDLHSSGDVLDTVKSWQLMLVILLMPLIWWLSWWYAPERRQKGSLKSRNESFSSRFFSNGPRTYLEMFRELSRTFKIRPCLCLFSTCSIACQDWRVEKLCIEHTFMSWSQYEPVRAPCHGVSRTAASGLGPVASLGVTYQWLERGAAYGYKKSPCRSAAASTLVWLAGRCVFESLPCCKCVAKTLTQDYVRA